MRFAVYFTPPADEPLTRRAARWLGRDAFSNAIMPLSSVESLSMTERQNLVRDPVRYGFHATLKAPLALADGKNEAGLLEAVQDFAAGWDAFEIPRLVLGQLGPFFALVPEGVHPPLQDFAGEIVRRFEPFRAPLSQADIARRNPEKLSPAERAHLMRWGYPYVFDEFRFHMTLTGPVEPSRQEIVHRQLEAEFSEFTDRPLVISHLAVFVEEERGAPFTVRAAFPLKEARP